MKPKYYILLLLILLIGSALFFYSGRYRPIEFLEIPQSSKPTASLAELTNASNTSPLISYKGFSLQLDQQNHQAKWVAYELTSEEVNTKKAKRKDNFRNDTLPGILTGNKSDYLRSGYDRGHLAPAADMAWDQTAMDQSFFFSNICPQTPDLNRGIWKKLEDQGRNWASEKNSLYIVTGPYIEHPADSIGSLAIPKYFYKAFLVYQKNTQQAIGFVMPNTKTVDGDIFDYAVSIDSIESLVDLNLYDKLPQRIEKKVEKGFNVSLWK